MPVQFLRRLGGIARSRDLQHAGFSRRRILSEIRQKTMVRPRKGWVAISDCEPLLLQAAANGLVVSCVTQARRLGLWNVGGADSVPHFRVRAAGAAKDPGRARLHWHRALVRVPPSSLVDSIEDALHMVAHCRPFDEALAVWESALRQRKADWSVLEALPMRGAARDVRAAALPFSDSGLETIFRTRLSWLRIPIYAQSWILGHRVDFLLGERLVVQIDGATHTGPQRTSDNEHDAQMLLRGYFVIRVGYRQVMHQWHEVQEVIMRAVAEGLHLRG